MRRRDVLAGSLAVVSGGLAGCIAGSGGDGDATTTATSTTAQGTETTTSTAESSTTTDGGTDTSTTDSESGGTTTESGGTTTDSGGTTTESDDGSSGTTTASPGSDSMAEGSFRVTDAGCGKGANEAKAEFVDGTVSITGTISGSDACHRARLARTATADGELTVVVETYREDGMCSQCITDIDYEATLRPEGGLPDRVVVRHRTGGETRTVVEQSR